MSIIECPKCSEENPAEAVMCWACYTPLGENAGRVGMAAGRAVGPESAKAKLARLLSDAVPYAALAGIIAHGWLPRSVRWPVLSGSLSVLGAPFLLDKWRERAELAKASSRAGEPATEVVEEPPTVRIAKTILLYAVKEKATRIRIEENGRGVQVFYQIEQDWREQMKMPLYVWLPLRQQLLDYARQGGLNSVAFVASGYPEDLYFASRIKAMSAHLKIGARGETLRLEFESALPEETALPLANLTEVYCRACREANAPDSVWCWSCGAVLQTQANLPVEIDDRVLLVIFFGALGVTASSGWFSRRARLLVAVAGVLGAAATFAVGSWIEGRRTNEIRRLRESRAAADKPAPGLSNAIVADGWNRDADVIQLQEHGNVVISHRIGEVWRQSRVLPAGTWLATRNQLLKRARENARSDGTNREIYADLTVDIDGETMALRFDPNAPAVADQTMEN